MNAFNFKRVFPFSVFISKAKSTVIINLGKTSKRVLSAIR